MALVQIQSEIAQKDSHVWLSLRQLRDELYRLEERVAALEVTTAAQQVTLDDHEARIIVLEP